MRREESMKTHSLMLCAQTDWLCEQIDRFAQWCLANLFRVDDLSFLFLTRLKAADSRVMASKARGEAADCWVWQHVREGSYAM